MEDWGLQACGSGEVQEYIKDCDPVWLNTVGTYGIGSASYHWNRFKALMVPIMIGVVGPGGLCWVLWFADDFLMLVRNSAVSRPLLMALSIPLKWWRVDGMGRLLHGFRLPRSWASATAGATGQFGGAACKHRGRSRSRPAARA